MNSEIKILMLVHWPGRLSMQMAADALGLEIHELAILIKAGLVKPLGGRHVPRNGHRYFSGSLIARLSKDEKFLSDAQAEIYKHWKRKNEKKQNKDIARLPAA